MASSTEHCSLSDHNTLCFVFQDDVQAEQQELLEKALSTKHCFETLCCVFQDEVQAAQQELLEQALSTKH